MVGTLWPVIDMIREFSSFEAAKQGFGAPACFEAPKKSHIVHSSFYAKGGQDRWESRSLLRFENVDRDHSFDAVISSDLTEHYDMRGGRFVGPENSALDC
jgi:hypothetical protein